MVPGARTTAQPPFLLSTGLLLLLVLLLATAPALPADPALAGVAERPPGSSLVTVTSTNNSTSSYNASSCEETLDGRVADRSEGDESMLNSGSHCVVLVLGESFRLFLAYRRVPPPGSSRQKSKRTFIPPPLDCDGDVAEGSAPEPSDGV
jgi:hypothetical protein